MSLNDHRRIVRQLLDDASPADAPTAYYALFHDEQRSALFTMADASGLGFVGRFQTGQDLFRPLVTMRCKTVEVADTLFAQALAYGRPYIFFANVNQLPLANGLLELQNEHIFSIYRLEVARFERVMNVLVVEKRTANGTPRCEIQAGGKVMAAAGVNWQSPAFAEIYVHTEVPAQQRGWGKSVVSALCQILLKDGRLPLYLVENNNTASKALAEGVGFVDTGSRQVYADMTYLGFKSTE